MVSQGLGAVSISRNWGIMEMVDYVELVTVPTFVQLKINEVNIRKGPPEVGKLLIETANLTPTPFGLEVAETEPIMLPRGSLGFEKDFAGNVAT